MSVVCFVDVDQLLYTNVCYPHHWFVGDPNVHELDICLDSAGHVVNI